MSNVFNSELEKPNLEVHVDMSRQRYTIMTDKVNAVNERVLILSNEFADFRNENSAALAEIKQTQLQSIANLRDQQSEESSSTVKVIVGAAATIGAGLLSVIVVLLVAFI